MIQRIFSTSLLLICFTVFAFAQVPESAIVKRTADNVQFRMMCDMQSAGTVAVDAANFTGSSNDIDFPEIYLCFGDELQLIHNRDFDLSGDPDGTTPGGVGYGFYSDVPSVSGTTRDLVFADPNFLKDPLGRAIIYVDQLNGDALFSNDLNIDTNADGNGDQSLQDFFNNGNPVRFWFAPITFDYDAGGIAGYEDNGSCVNVNTAAAFSVVYLNPIQEVNPTPAALAGSFTVSGGLPEFDGSNYSSITVELASNPTITGSVTSGAASNGSQVDFTVPQAGTYLITITDDKGCPYTFTMEISMFDPLELQLGCGYGNPTREVCLSLTADNFEQIIGMQFALNWDSTLISFNRIRSSASAPELAGLSFNADSSGVLIIQWDDFSSVTYPDGTLLFDVCFTAIGTQGDQAIITFADPPNPNLFIEIVRDGPEIIGLEPGNGKVYIGSAPSTSLDVPPASISSQACDPTQPGGSITFTTQDGVPGGYQYQWENTTTGETGMGMIANSGDSETIFGLSAGDYSISVVDQGCGVDMFTRNIPDSNVGADVITNTQPSCFGATDGVVEAVVFLNGNPVSNPVINGYTFAWQGSTNTSNMLTNVPSGNYSVTVTDPNGCTAEASATLSQPTVILDPNNNFDLVVTDESCNGMGDDGAITVTPSGGTGSAITDYSYQWSENGTTRPETTNSLTGLSAGNYSLTVTDQNMCEEVRPITVSVPTPPTVDGFDSTSVACVNDLTGSLTVRATPNGSTSLTNFDWIGPNGFTGTGATIDNIGPGKYYVNITASDGCIVTDSATLFAPSALVTGMVTPTNPTCPGDDNGSLSVQVSGGTTPYFYQWSTGDSGDNLSTLPRITAGTYTVTIIDANQCDSIIITETLQDPPSISASFTNLQSVSCFEGIPCDGGATVLASGGSSTSGVYTFTWESGESDVGMSSTASQLCQGTTFVIISDGICGDSFFVDIPTPDRLNIDMDATDINNVSCNGGDDGSVTVVPTGGTPAYTFLWQDGSTNPTLDNLSQGTYTVEITDANGCILPFSFPVGEPDVLVASIDSANSMDVSCFGEMDGVVAVKWEGGNGAGGESYAWSPNVADVATATNLSAGTYQITVTDRKGCTDETLYTVNQPPQVQASIPQPDDPACFGFQTQVSVFAATGGVGGPYSFSVNNSPQQQIDATIPIFAGADIPVSVFDAAGCRYDTTLTITEPPEIVVDLGPDQEVQLGSSTILDPFIGSFNPIDSFIWTPTDQFFTCPDSASVDCSRPTITPLTTATYVLTVIDNNGCMGTDQITIEVDKRRNVFIPNAFSPDGNGFNDEFYPQTGFGVQRINSMHIFDRWGKLMFLAEDFGPDDFDSRWDGRFNNKRVNGGVYVYLIEVTFLDGVTLLYRGDVAVVR